VLVEHPGYFSGPTGDFRIHKGRLAWLRAACDTYCAARRIARVPLEESAAWLRERKEEAGGGRCYVVWDPLDNSVAASLLAALGPRLRVDPAHPGFAIRDPGSYTGALTVRSVLRHCAALVGVMEGVASTDSLNRKPPDPLIRAAASKLEGAGSSRSRRRSADAAVQRAVSWAEGLRCGLPGSDAGAARLFPPDRAAALARLRAFSTGGKLALFGPYQDAVLTRGGLVFGVHSGLSAAMNVGLVLPEECALAADAAMRTSGVPLQSAEAYVRQVLGWREYARLVYHRHGGQLESGPLKGYPRLPAPWYDPAGTTPLADAVRRALATAHLDHITRLMVVNGLAVLVGAHPGGVLRWFSELAAADAHQWVMVANIAHMSALRVPGSAHGLARRSYVCSSAYIRRMSDIPGGDWEDSLDALFFAYLSRAPPGSEFYRGALRGRRYRSEPRRWAALADAAAASLAGDGKRAGDVER
jgi:hypothetical protein